MDTKYKPLPTIREDPQRTSYDSSTTLDELDDAEISLKYINEDTDAVLLRQERCRRPPVWLWIVQGILFSLSLTMFAMTWMLPSSTLRHVRAYSAWSPAATSVEYNHVRYNITTAGNRFVGAAPEVDEAWREISYDVGDQWLSKTDIHKLEMPESSLKVNHPQTGEEGYRVGIEVFHQLHCLNLLRRIAYKEYYEPLGGEFAGGPEKLKKHADHCIEVLRLNLQCNADIGVFTLYLIDPDPLPWPALNSNHVCRNFEKVREWALDHSVGNMEV